MTPKTTCLKDYSFSKDFNISDYNLLFPWVEIKRCSSKPGPPSATPLKSDLFAGGRRASSSLENLIPADGSPSARRAPDKLQLEFPLLTEDHYLQCSSGRHASLGIASRSTSWVLPLAHTRGTRERLEGATGRIRIVPRPIDRFVFEPRRGRPPTRGSLISGKERTA